MKLNQVHQYDIIDITIVIGFLVTLGAMCYMMVTNQDVPTLMQTVFWTLAVGLGLKKAPVNLDR